MATADSGFQPRNTPAERRAFFEQQRLIADLKAQLAAANATIADHEARIAALEP